MPAELEDYRWLIGDAARPWLERAIEELAAGTPLVRVADRLRKDLSAARTHLVLSQAELRAKARDKFSRAGQMFFTPQGLAQATDEPLARYKAARFPANQQIADLCCGIGGDLIALGVVGDCVAVDRDPTLALLAQANASAYGSTSVRVECRDVIAPDALLGQAWHLDPDRRAPGKRTVRTELFQPPWPLVEELLARRDAAAVKLAPATQLATEDAARCHREWIESRGECRQQVAWFGSLAEHTGHCSATVIDAADRPVTITGSYDAEIPLATSLGRFLYEPCAAVLAAHLAGALCQRHHLAAVSPGIAYLSGISLIDEPLMAAFEVLETMPLDRRKLAQALAERRIGRVEVKKRAVDVDPARLARELSRPEGEPGVVLIAPLGGQTKAIIARRADRRPL